MRNFELMAAEPEASYGLMTDFDFGKPQKPYKEPSTQSEKNYGASISTLIELLEAGEL